MVFPVGVGGWGQKVNCISFPTTTLILSLTQMDHMHTQTLSHGCVWRCLTTQTHNTHTHTGAHPPVLHRTHTPSVPPPIRPSSDSLTHSISPQFHISGLIRWQPLTLHHALGSISKHSPPFFVSHSPALHPSSCHSLLYGLCHLSQHKPSLHLWPPPPHSPSPPIPHNTLSPIHPTFTCCTPPPPSLARSLSPSFTHVYPHPVPDPVTCKSCKWVEKLSLTFPF